jgi:hypothetical protein
MFLRQLQETLIFNQYINKIDLPNNVFYTGNIATISGWGWTTFPGDDIADILQKATVRIINNIDCATYFEFPIRDDQICTVDDSGIGICHVSLL